MMCLFYKVFVCMRVFIIIIIIEYCRYQVDDKSIDREFVY